MRPIVFKAMGYAIVLNFGVSVAAVWLTVLLRLSAFSDDVPAGIVVAYALNAPGMALLTALVPRIADADVSAPWAVAVVVLSGAMYGLVYALWHDLRKRRRGGGSSRD